MTLRDENLEKLAATHHDVLVVGGGINGAVAAAALAARGARVALVERGDFACFTSQESSNLAWGGIKYMETFEFPLVRGLCMARNHLMESFPSTVQEVRFLATLPGGFRRHPLLVWLGTWAYWIIGNGYTRPPRWLSRRRVEKEEPVVNTARFGGAVEYSDAYLHDNDARFVFNFVRAAMDRGCVAVNYAESLGATRTDNGWRTRVHDVLSGRRMEVESTVLVNAAGPFVDEHNLLSRQNTRYHHVFSKGVHLIVDRLTPHQRVLAFFADDGRLFFAIPMGSKTCLGTTDTRVSTPFTEVTDEDRDFVLDNINRRLRLARPLTRADIIAERCGVRPLALANGADDTTDFLQLSRRHVIEADPGRGHLSIFGGKLTDCLNVGDEVCAYAEVMGVQLSREPRQWYGEPPGSVREEYMLQADRMGLDAGATDGAAEPLSARLWRRYGVRAFDLLERIREDPRQAEILIEGTEYRRCELDEAAHQEMIVKLEDFLRRRSKIALILRTDEIRAAPGLMEACRVLFGDDARARYDEYFARTR